MALCTSGQKTTIKWQYPGESENQILGADGYSLEQEKGKCPVLYHVFGQYISLNLDSCGLRSYWRTSYAVNGGLVTDYLPQKTQDNEWVIPLNTGFNHPIRPINFTLYSSKNLGDTTGNLFYTSGGCINISSPTYGGRLDLGEIEIIRVDGQPDNCGDCTFKVTKNNTVVYQKTTPTCPTVNHFCGEQCPAGSCECNCGTRVCCHHPTTGAVIKSFTR
jgi:hypothetical protein